VGDKTVEEGPGGRATLRRVQEALLRAGVERDVTIAPQVEKDRPACDQTEADMGLKGKSGHCKRGRAGRGLRARSVIRR
jgi:hypothetical protein